MKTEIDLKYCRGVSTENPMEYRFPWGAEDVAGVFGQVAHRKSWVLQTAMLPVAEANCRLRERLLLPYLSEFPACRRFSESSRCVAVVVRADIAWMLCESHFDPDHKCVFFIGDQGSEEGITHNSGWKFESDEEIASFVSAYCGFREDYPPLAGHLLALDHSSKELKTRDDRLLTERFSGWEHSVCFYKSLTGDFLLLRSDGVSGWCVAEEDDVRIYSHSFLEFSKRFFRHFTTAFYYDAEQMCHLIEPLDPFCNKPCCRH